MSPNVEVTSHDMASSGVYPQTESRWGVAVKAKRSSVEKLRIFSRTVLTEKGESAFKRLAVCLDGRLVNVPRLMEEITDGIVRINGRFSEAEARGIAQGIVGLAGTPGK